MSSLQMPKVDNAIMSKKDKIALDLRRIINSKNVLSNPDELRPFETDGLTAYRQMPLSSYAWDCRGSKSNFKIL